MAQTKRRIRVKRNPQKTVTPAKKLSEMKDKAREIEDLAAQVMELNEQIKAREAEIFTFMQAYKVNVVDGTYGDFLYDIPSGKSVTEIDINDLFERMEVEDFLGVVKPSVTEVKKHFSPKELAEFSTVHPAKPGEPRVKYKPHKK